MKIYEIIRDHEIIAKDGTTLRGDLYKQSGISPSPVVLFRTPYQKERLWNEIFSPMDCVEAGFCAYVQDLRGFGKSEGIPNLVNWEAENQDTFETVAHLANSDGCSGEVAVGGTSFVGMVALSCVNNPHPAVKALFPSMIAVNPFEEDRTSPWIRFEEVLVWLLQMSVQKELRKCGGDFVKLSPAVKQAAGCLGDIAKLFADIKANGLPAFVSELESGLISSIMRGETNPFPSISSVEIGRLPALFLTGWYDTFSNATVAAADAWNEGGARAGASLIVGPWSHSNQLISNIGQINFGAKATGAAISVQKRHAQFLNACFKGEAPPQVSTEYELFGNRWVTGATDAPSKPISLVLTSDRKDKTLITNAEEDWAPNWGGQTHFSAGGVPGPIDQSILAKRQDVACFMSNVFETPVAICKPIVVDLAGLRTGADILFLKVVLIFEDGVMLPIQEGVCDLSKNDQTYAFPRIRFSAPRNAKLGLLVSRHSYPRYMTPIGQDIEIADLQLAPKQLLTICTE